MTPGERLKKMEEHHKAAFEVLSKDGKISETAVVEALLHGHEKMLCVKNCWPSWWFSMIWFFEVLAPNFGTNMS